MGRSYSLGFFFQLNRKLSELCVFRGGSRGVGGVPRGQDFSFLGDSQTLKRVGKTFGHKQANG